MKKSYLLLYIFILTFSGVYAQGTSIAFDGSSQVFLANDSNFNPDALSSRTYECWFKVDDVTISANKQTIFKAGDGSNGFNIYVYDSKLYVGAYASNASWSTGTYLSTTNITSNTWHHVALVLNNAGATLADDKLLAYVDGVLYGSGQGATIDEQSGTNAWGNSSNKTRFHDGVIPFSENNYLEGEIDEFKAWDAARSADDIREGMNNQLTGSETDLVLYYNFDGTGTTITDQTSNAINGTVGGTESRPTAGIYTTWDTGNGSTDWTSASNWDNGVPGSSTSGLLKIPSGGTQPIITTAVTGKSIQIENGASLEINAGGSLTLSGSAEINGAESLIIHSDATNTGNFIEGGGITYKNSGSVKVERFMEYVVTTFPGGYHYISSPVNNHSKFNDMEHLYGYRESDLTWLNHTDPTDGFSSFTNGAGYAIRYINDETKEFTGALNTGDYTVAITATDHGGNAFEHYNLIGNPYPSSISADSIVDNNSIINANVYFWNGEDYATYNTGTNAGTAGSIGSAPDGQIAVGQAFYVDANTSGDLTLSNSMRGTDSNIFYREKSYPQLRVVLTSNYGKSDLFLTGHKASTFGLDNYDAKHLPGNGNLSLSALMDGVAYDIQSVPQIDANAFDLQVVAKQDDQIRFALQEVKDLNGMHVYLEDRETGTVTDISTDSYTAYLTEGTSNNRFKLRIAKEEAAFTAWINNGRVEAFAEGETAQSIRLIALDGKTVASSNSMQFNNWEQLANGIYLLEVTTDMNKHISKIIK